MGEIKYKNGEITIDESIVKQLRYTEGKCIIHVSCENKFEGPPEKLAIFVCNSLSKELGREVILNIMNSSKTESNPHLYTTEATFEAKISQQMSN